MTNKLEVGYEFTRAQIAELESLRAWKAEIERQEPVAYMHEIFGAVCFKRSRSNNPISHEIPLYAAPVIRQQIDVDELAQFIREINGQNKLGAGLLAEALVDRFFPRCPDSAARIAELEAEVAQLHKIIDEELADSGQIIIERDELEAEVARLNESLEAKITICGDERITELREKLKVAREALKDIEGAHSTDRLICREALATIGEE